MATKNTNYINRYNKRRKLLMVNGFGGKCQCCGYDKTISALEFHHLDPSKKEITLSRSILSWEKTKKELKKCICVCANCHREIHDGLREIDTTKQYFDESLINYNPLESQKHQQNIWDKCPVCGKLKLITKKYCSQQCACKNQKKYNWKNIDVIDLIDNKKIPIQTIANEVGCSWNAIKKRYKKLKNI